MDEQPPEEKPLKYDENHNAAIFSSIENDLPECLKKRVRLLCEIYDRRQIPLSIRFGGNGTIIIGADKEAYSALYKKEYPNPWEFEIYEYLGACEQIVKTMRARFPWQADSYF